MPITLPPAAPVITDSPATFDSKASAFVAYQSTLVTELNAALAAVNMTKWISGTTYAIGDVTWSPITFYAYRRKTAGAGTTDPSSDTTNWISIASAAAGANADITSMTALTAPTVAANPIRATDLQSQLVTAFTTGGTGTAFTLTPTPALAANAAKVRYNATLSADPSGSPTLAVSGNTALPLAYYDSNGATQYITTAQAKSGMILDVVCNGSIWVVLNPITRRGTSTNDAALAGMPGEYVESVASLVSAPATTTYGDLASISLTAGDWDISAMIVASPNTGTSMTGVFGGIGTASGNNGAGLTTGDTYGGAAPPTAQYSPTITIPAKRVSISATTTYYLKMLMGYSGGTPQFSGRISARRVR